MNNVWIGALGLAIASVLAQADTPPRSELRVQQAPFGYMPDGAPVSLYTLTNAKGMAVKLTNLGGIITQTSVPDKNGVMADVVLGFDELEPYLTKSPYFGALIGRYANRIAKGKFSIDGHHYQLATNNGENALHGGLMGFSRKLWQAESFATTSSVGVKLHLISEDGDQGYPGNLDVSVTYTLTNDNEIQVSFKAKTDKATPVNFTQHNYFNLAGKGNILEHNMMINADHITPIDSSLIPTGELATVEGTPFDFRKPHTIGERINHTNQQLSFGNGYDHNFVLRQKMPNEYVLAAKVVEPNSGRVLEVFTDQPGIQFYTGNFLDGTLTGKGQTYQVRSGFCLEPQHFPDSPNHSNFPDTILKPGEEYSMKMSYKFSVLK